MFVCLLDIPSQSNRIQCTCYIWEEAEFIGEGSYRKINSIPTTLLRLWAKTELSYLSTTFFISDVAIEDTLKVQAIFRFFFFYLTLRASDTQKVQTDYLTFGNLITTSDTPKVQSSEAIAVEEYLLKLYAAIIIVFFSFKQDTSPEY